AAEGAGADASAEQASQRRVVRADAIDRGPDGLGDAGAGAFRRHAHAAVSPAESDGGGARLGERLALGSCGRRSREVVGPLCLVEGGSQSVEALAVGALRLRVE